MAIVNNASYQANVAFSRGTGWRGLCPAQTVTDRTVGYNAWLADPSPWTRNLYSFLQVLSYEFMSLSVSR